MCQSKMKEESIEGLILIISDKDENHQKSEQAFTILYHRYGKYFLGVIFKMLADSGQYDEEFANEILDNVFIEIYSNPLKFSFDSNKHSTEEEAFKAWVYTLVKYEFLDRIMELTQQRRKELLILDDDASFYEVEDIIEVNSESVNSTMMEGALSSLSDRDRHIVSTYYLFYEEGKNAPSETLDMLCELYGTTRPNLRKIRERARKKIIAYVENKSNLKAV